MMEAAMQPGYRIRVFANVRREPEAHPLRPTVQALRDMRQARGISVRRLAKLTGYHQSTICRIESGRARPRIDQIEDIAQALGAVVVVA